MDFDLTTAIRAIRLIVYAILLGIIFSKRGMFLNMLQNNMDIYGIKHSWKKTIVGLVTFLLSVPLIIFLTLYAASTKLENVFAVIAAFFFIVVVILLLRQISKDKKGKKRLWEE